MQSVIWPYGGAIGFLLVRSSAGFDSQLLHCSFNVAQMMSVTRSPLSMHQDSQELYRLLAEYSDYVSKSLLHMISNADTIHQLLAPMMEEIKWNANSDTEADLTSSQSRFSCPLSPTVRGSLQNKLVWLKSRDGSCITLSVHVRLHKNV